MKKSVLALMILMTSASAFAKLTPATVKGFAGQYPFDVMKNADVRALVNSTLLSTNAIRSSAAVKKAIVDDLDTSMSVSSPSTLGDGRFLLLSGCEAHNCSDNSALIVIDSSNPSAAVIIRQNTIQVGNDFKDAKSISANADWTSTIGLDLSKFPASVQAAIAGMTSN